MISGNMRGDLGLSLNPVKLVKKAAGGVKTVAKGSITVAQKTGGIARNSLVQDAVGIIPVVGTSAQSALKTYGKATAYIPGGGSKSAPAAKEGADGTVDLAPQQDAAAAQAAPLPAGGGDMINLPGIGMVPKKTALIGGGVLGALVLVLLLRK